MAVNLENSQKAQLSSKIMFLREKESAKVNQDAEITYYHQKDVVKIHRIVLTNVLICIRTSAVCLLIVSHSWSVYQ